MKIDGTQKPVQMDAYLKQVGDQQQKADSQQVKAGQTTQYDKVDLSDRAREIQQASQTLKQMPDVREDKVQQVKMDVEKGTYKVVGSQVATDMLRESFENDLVLQKVNMRV